MRRSGFTLIEVMAAVMIATVAGMALLKISSQSTFLFTKIKETSSMSETLSIAGAHASKRFDKLSPSLYDLLDNTYTITNDEFRRYLKNQQYRYQEKVVDTIVFGGMFGGSEDDLYNESVADGSVPIIQFELIEVSLSNKDQQGAVVMARVF